MKTNRINARVAPTPNAVARKQSTILDPRTRQVRLLDADECFPIAGRLLSGVWQLDDGRVLMAMSTASAAATEGGEQWQPTIRVDYVDVTGGAVRIAPPRRPRVAPVASGQPVGVDSLPSARLQW